MAMSPRPDNGIIRAIRPTNQPVYEDFRTLSEWKQGQGADILLVHIPGFTKEQIRVTFESSSMLKARGERPLENNRWSRFNQDYRIPEDCNVRGIHAMFEGGILSITMPKKIVPSEPTREAKTTQHPPSTPKGSTTEPKPEKSSEDKKSVVDTPRPPETKKDLPKFQDEKSAKPPSPKKVATDEEDRRTNVDTPRPPKVDANKDREEKSDKYPSPKKASTETKPEKSLEDDRKTIVDTPSVKKTEGDQLKHLKGQDDAKPEKSSKEPVKKIIEYSTPAAEIKDFSGDNKSDNVSGGHGEDKAGGDQLENFNKIVQGLIMKIKEGRGPLVNVGVAVLIIVALGVYMFSGKAKN